MMLCNYGNFRIAQGYSELGRLVTSDHDTFLLLSPTMPAVDECIRLIDQHGELQFVFWRLFFLYGILTLLSI